MTDMWHVHSYINKEFGNGGQIRHLDNQMIHCYQIKFAWNGFFAASDINQADMFK